MGTRDDVDGGTNHSLGVGIVRRGHRNREFIAGNAPANHARGQRLPYSPGDGNDELIAAKNAVRCGDIIHAIEFDQRKGRALIVGALCEGKIQELQCLCVIGQPGQLVFVGGARGLHLARRELPLRPLELPERQRSKAEYDDGDGCEERRQPPHDLSHRTAFFPCKKSGNAAGGIHHRLRFAVARGAAFKFQVFQTGDLLCHPQQPRINCRRTVERRPEFCHGAAQRGVMAERQSLVVMARQTETDGGDREHARNGDKRQHADQPRSRLDPLCRRRPRKRE